jgi:hypothetical protein
MLPTRHLSLPLLALVGVGATAGSARAQVDLGGAAITLELQVPDDDKGTSFSPPDSEQEALEFMNRASCVCADQSLRVHLELDPPDTTGIDTYEVLLWAGTGCDDEDSSIRDMQCVQFDEAIADVEDLPTDRDLPVRDLISSDAEDPCPANNTSRSVFAIIDPGNDGFDEGDYAVSLEIATDTRPPPAPTNIAVRGAEGAAEISWSLGSPEDDVEYFQVLCAEVTDAGLQTVRSEEPRYRTSADVCGEPDPLTVIETAPGVLPSDDALTELNTEFVCGEVSGTATSIRVDGFENGVDYRLVLVAVDPAGNPTAVDLGIATPKPARDFWEDYLDQGGTAEGGCAAGGGGLLGLLVIGGLLLGRVGRRRTTASAILVVLLTAAPAVRAQPYLDEDQELEDDLGPSPVLWNLELKMGPFLPGIDDQLDLPAGQEGPFARMFGDHTMWLSQVTLERYFVRQFGLLGLSASLGYFATDANAYQEDASGDVALNANGKPLRSEGDETSFNLMPMSLGVVYRFSVLDDLYGIPLVPYGRAGLAYYAWWVKSPSGETSEGPDADCADPDTGCSGDRGRGGSLGWQGTVGLAIRAERIDPEAEASLHNELGIAHAGVFAELTLADVDGFGAADKLAVGDLFWSFGLTFEF